MTALAVDIGGTKIAAARVDENGDIDGPVLTRSTPAAQGPQAVVEAVAEALGQLDRSDGTFVAISSAGVINALTGTVEAATSSLPGWTGTHLAETIHEAIHLPTIALGDGHAFAVGEAIYGAGKGLHSVLVLAVGTGIGGSYVVGGEPMLGAHGAGGHFGHLPVPQAEGIPCYCGRTGHLEAVGSGAGLVRLYRTSGGLAKTDSAADVVRRAAKGDPVAVAALQRSAGAIGTAAAGLTNAFDPDVVVVTGGLTKAGTIWSDPLTAHYRASLIPYLANTPLTLAAPSNWAALRGAAHYARRRQQP